MLAQLHNPWRARMHRNAAGSIVNAAVMNYDTVDFDPGGNLTTGGSSSYTVPVAGYYAMSARASLSTTAGSQSLLVVIEKNGGELVRGVHMFSVATGQVIGCVASSPSELLNVGDVIQVVNFGSTGLSYEVGGGSLNFFSISFVNPA